MVDESKKTGREVLVSRKRMKWRIHKTNVTREGEVGVGELDWFLHDWRWCAEKWMRDKMPWDPEIRRPRVFNVFSGNEMKEMEKRIWTCKRVASKRDDVRKFSLWKLFSTYSSFACIFSPLMPWLLNQTPEDKSTYGLLGLPPSPSWLKDLMLYAPQGFKHCILSLQ